MITSPSSQVLAHFDAPVLTLTFNRPARKNALSLEMYTALAELIEAANANPQVRVILLTGSGNCFTSGNDLQDFMSQPEIHAEHPVVRFMSALSDSTKPLVAQVRGHAVGIGTTLLLHCDLVYAAADACLQLPFVNLGLCPEYASSYLLPRLVGQQKAAELMLLGEPFDGTEAERLGIVTKALPGEQLGAYVRKRVERLAQQPPAAVRRAKTLLHSATQIPIDMALCEEFTRFAEGLSSAECKEAMSAFFEKRAPDFSRF